MVDESKGTYSVKFKCLNCQFIFTCEIEKGVTAKGRARVCPTCGCSEDSTIRGGQKLGEFPLVTDDEIKQTNEPKYEVLLESDGITIKKERS